MSTIMDRLAGEFQRKFNGRKIKNTPIKLKLKSHLVVYSTIPEIVETLNDVIDEKSGAVFYPGSDIDEISKTTKKHKLLVHIDETYPEGQNIMVLIPAGSTVLACMDMESDYENGEPVARNYISKNIKIVYKGLIVHIEVTDGSELEAMFE